ncbi:MAG TPA: hypothetical protein VHV83_09390 [Armatimonadota bacterium]|nr:hypothetical protein [Armatimonadota bacterium]
MPIILHAQDFSFAGRDVVLLANAVATQAQTTYTLPSAYLIQLGGDKPAVLTAPMVFEIFARAIDRWKSSHAFPDKVSGVSLNLHAPPANPATEPGKDRKIQIPAIAQDIIDKAPNWVSFAQANQGVLPGRLSFEAGYKLTAAQYAVAMAMLISQSARDQKIPTTLAVPAVHSPANWEYQGNPISVGIQPQAQEQQLVVHVAINNIELPKGDAPLPVELSQPFCGPITIAFNSEGPIAQTTISIDGDVLATIKKGAANGYTIDSLQFTDDTHILSVNTIDTNGNIHPVIFSFRIQNGRSNSMTPAIIEKTAEQSASDAE